LQADFSTALFERSASVISTGLPDQNSFSLSAEILNPGGGNVLDDGVVSTLTIRAADAFNNPALDGTSVIFNAEYGDVTPSCTTVDGACSVIWTSSGTRAVDFASTGTMRTLANTACDHDGGGADHFDEDLPCPTYNFNFPLGQIYSGRTTILAYADGDESFDDLSGNGLYDYVDVNLNNSYDADTDTLEPFVDLPEAFRDDNEDGVFGKDGAAFENNSGLPCTADDGTDQCTGWLDSGQEEFFFDINENGRYDGDDDGNSNNGMVGNGIFNGVLCAEELELLTLCTRLPISVRSEVVLIMSDNTPVVDFRNGDYSLLASGAVVDVDVGGPTLIRALIGDINNNLPVVGTTIEIAVDNCDFSGAVSYSIGNTNEAGIFDIPITFAEDDSVDGDVGTVIVTATTITSFSSGATKSFIQTDSFTCVDAD